MASNPLNNNLADFEAVILSLFEKYLDLIPKKQYKEADALCTNFINHYGNAFKQRIYNDVDENKYNNLLISLVFVKGLHDYLQLCQMTRHDDWHEDNSNIERVWTKLCDCRERLKFSSRFCQSTAIDIIAQNLDGLETFFQNAFGNGYYLSPGIIVDKYLCNICCKDSRGCSHVAGRLYSGSICSYRPVNPQINHVALVKIPKDPRCRIWAWHFLDNNEGKEVKFKSPILTSFGVDNFLRDY